MWRTVDAWMAGAAFLLAATLAAPTAAGRQQPTRDTPAQKPAAEMTARISGRVVAADTGRPVRRARVFLSSAEMPGGLGALTDDNGAFDLASLPAGRYSVTASMAGFVTLSYGQRRPFLPGSPIQVADGQHVKGIDFRLPRGSVIAGHVLDESGEPSIGTTVRVLRYVLQDGQRRLVPSGSDITDDQGSFRVWGLNPGTYYIEAQPRRSTEAPTEHAADAPEGQKGYAPTYFPGAASAADAQTIAVGLGQERAGVDFNLQFVPVARVEGRVINALGNPSRTGSVTLVAEAARGTVAINYGGPIRPGGVFQILNVPPGRYTLQARGTDNGAAESASLPLAVSGSDIDNLIVALSHSAIVSGTVAFSGQQQSMNASRLKVAAIPIEASIGGLPQATPTADSQFVIKGIPAGARLFRLTGETYGWTLKSVIVGDQDVTDTPVDLRAGAELAGVMLHLTDRAAEIRGTITTDRGAPISDYTLLAFSTSPSHWNPQSRFILTARPDQNGTFSIRGMPDGSYYLVAVDPTEQGEWLDAAYLDAQRSRATRITVAEGEVKTQDFRVATQ